MVAMLVFATGGHWLMLQSVAWVKMTVDFSRSEALSSALKKTFDGQHPCQLCKLVNEGKKSERERELQKLDVKFDFFCASEVLLVNSPPPYPQIISPFSAFNSRADSPPSPPPRLS